MPLVEIKGHDWDAGPVGGKCEEGSDDMVGESGGEHAMQAKDSHGRGVADI
jgi:hypothetical protein